ncbi:MAG: hypothetical protein AB7P31_07375 [Steroidobacteraceae bacterium]
MKRLLPALAAAALVTALPGPALSAATHHEAASSAATSTTIAVKLADTKDALRGLWFQHIFWVRNVVVARLDGDAAAAKAAEAEVVANAKAIAGAVEPFYGKAASDQLFTLLAGHWGAISAYVDATKAGSKAQESAAFAKLSSNANAIADFLAGANPHWPAATLRGLLSAHGAHHVQQIQQLHAGQYDAEARTWAAMASHMNVIADALANGLAAQFPDKFR